MTSINKPESVFDQLSSGKTPNVEVAKEAAASLTAGVDNNLLGQLVQLMVLEQQERLQQSEGVKKAANSRQAQRDRNAKDQDSKLLLKQAKCRHLKGGKRGPKSQNKDYAVYQHRFISFIQYIRCAICGMKWYPEDTAEYLVRKGHKISNHTKIGWREAVGMMEASTNTMSASESIPSIMAGQPQVYRDGAGLPVSPRMVDLEGNKVDNVEL